MLEKNRAAMKMNHRMSLENLTLREAERVIDQRRSETNAVKGQQKAGNSDGVDVGGTVGSGNEISQETSDIGNGIPTGNTSGKDREVGSDGGGVGMHRSSEDHRDIKTREERRVHTWEQETQRSEGRGDGSVKTGIQTPDKVRKLQIVLYRKAKAEPQYRFWSLYGDLCRLDVLEMALKRVTAQGGVGGIDGEEIVDINASEETRQQWIEHLRHELTGKKYVASPVRRVYIEKVGGGQRPLGIPTIKDRVVQMAAYLILMPIFEADFHAKSYGFRPKRKAKDAMEAISQSLYEGYTEVIDADLTQYFDTIDHRRLMKLVSRRVSDGSMLALIRQWLRAPIVEEVGGKRKVIPNRKGTPQGGVLSPLLANIYLDQLDHGVNEQTENKARMVRYADDFVILCRPGWSPKIQERLKQWLQRRELALNEEKTRVVNSRKEGFCFLGFSVTWRQSRKKRGYVHVEPSKRSRERFAYRLRQMACKGTTIAVTPLKIKEVNRYTTGWANYFRYGCGNRVFLQLNDLLQQRVRRWLWHKHSYSRPLYGHYTRNKLRGKYGLKPLEWGAGVFAR